jgi:hypothetical protein
MSNKIFKTIKKAGFFEKTLGLMFKKRAYPLFFETRFGIHTFFLNFPIDVIILDNKNQVIKLKRNLRPNRLFFWNPKCKRVLELPEGEITKKKIKKSDLIDLM